MGDGSPSGKGCCYCAGKIESGLDKNHWSTEWFAKPYIHLCPSVRSRIKPERRKRGYPGRLFFCKVYVVSHYTCNLSSYLGAETAIFVSVGKDFYHKAKDKCLLAQIQWMSWKEAKAYTSKVPLSKALSHQTLHIASADICVWTHHWS